MIAIIAEIIVITPNWLTDLNSESKSGSKVTITTIVVFITALAVIFSEVLIALSLDIPFMTLNL